PPGVRRPAGRAPGRPSGSSRGPAGLAARAVAARARAGPGRPRSGGPGLAVAARVAGDGSVGAARPARAHGLEALDDPPPAHQPGQEVPELGPQVGTVEGQLDRGPEEIDLLAD